jgi:RHS repeat-associated protein
MLPALSLQAQTEVTSPMTGTPSAGEYFSYTGITLSPNFTFTATPGQSLHLYISDPDCQALNTLPSSNQNYILTSVPRQPGVNPSATGLSTCDLMQTVAYFDGLGRPLQTVQVKGSPLGADVVQSIVYDQFGREAAKFLPYALQTGLSDGSYKTNALTAQPAFYTIPPTGVSVIPNPYAVTVFEPSPLNRVTEQGAPGTAWQPNTTNPDLSHTSRITYGTNDVTALTDIAGTNKVLLYTGDIAADGTRTLVDAGTNAYGAGQLYVTTTKDENWQAADGRAGTMQEFKDKEGRVVLKRIFNKNTDGTAEMLSTYYVYDDLGNLCYVLPPGALPDGGTVSATTLKHLCYQYRYDERNRLVEKQLPGKGRELIVYNKLDQVVMTQDAMQRSTPNQQWAVTKYDALGRVVVTGLYTDAGSAATIEYRTNMQNAVTANTSLWEKRVSTGNGYNTAIVGGVYLAFPTTLNTTLSVNYYDDYNIPGLPTAYDKHLETGMSTMTTGLQTASLIKAIDGTTGSNNMLWTVNYYDDKGRNNRSFAQHFKGGAVSLTNYDEVNNTYSFTDELLTSSRKNYSGSAQPSVTVNMSYAYDHSGRKTNTWEEINGNKVLLSRMVYNEVGQLMDKKLHSTNEGGSFLQSVDYRYNSRGWLKSINNAALNNSNPLINDDTNDAFGEELSYEDYAVTGLKQYNGNISAVSWQGKVPSGSTAPQVVQGFEYNYDRINRLTKAGYTTTGKADQYNEALSYDRMGNIKSLARYKADAVNPMDNLSYIYENGDNSNRLLSVTDNSSNDLGQPIGTATYVNDLNGNLQSDSKKQLGFTYNYLNLPYIITKSGLGAGTITYIYNAAGTKLRKVLSGANRDYVGGIEYNNEGNIDFIQTEEGRARPNGGSYFYEYMLKDHLGNSRVMIAQDGVVGQQTDYYAFGMEMSRGISTVPSPDNKYKYNGKELQDELGLNQYDYGARFYDPVIGRWTSVDPLAELGRRWSPYVYGFDNPMLHTDPDGMWPYPINIRSFAPFKEFGGWFKGDNRGFSTSLSATSRLAQSFTVDPSKGSYMGLKTWSSPSSHPWFGSATAKDDRGAISNFSAQANKDGSNKVSFTSTMAGANPLIKGSPDIDIKTNFTLTENTKAGTLNVNAVQTGDAFPSAETLIGDTKGNQLFIGVSAANGSPYTALPGNFDKPMMEANFTINMDAKGVFTGVTQGDNKYSVSEWNKMNQSQPAKKKQQQGYGVEY